LDSTIKRLGVISALVLVFCGWSGLATLWSSIGQALTAFMPFIWEGIKYAVEEYITSPYFITGAIMMVASGFGIWFGARGGKVLYLVVSIIGAIASLASMGVSFI